ncbi:hypothetical protein D3C87_1784610 [compost metagenome]
MSLEARMTCEETAHDRSLRLPDHLQMAAEGFGRAAALFDPDAERRESVDHAGGNRAGL